MGGAVEAVAYIGTKGREPVWRQCHVRFDDDSFGSRKAKAIRCSDLRGLDSGNTLHQYDALLYRIDVCIYPFQPSPEVGKMTDEQKFGKYQSIHERMPGLEGSEISNVCELLYIKDKDVTLRILDRIGNRCVKGKRKR